MYLFETAEFDAFTLSLPGATLADQWESRVAKVGGKVFTLLTQSADGGRIVFKCGEETFEILASVAGIGQAPYFAKRQWVSVSEKADLSEEELREYIRRSHRIVASGLTKKLRAELGIV